MRRKPLCGVYFVLKWADFSNHMKEDTFTSLQSPWWFWFFQPAGSTGSRKSGTAKAFETVQCPQQNLLRGGVLWPYKREHFLPTDYAPVPGPGRFPSLVCAWILDPGHFYANGWND